MPPTLNFPNASRSYDHARQAVRFWGHDRAMETAFVVTAEALRLMQPDVSLDETSLLGAFDQHRDAIHAAAVRAYERHRKPSYALGPDSF